MEGRVAMSLIWLGSGNGLQLVGDLFGVTKGTNQRVLSHDKVASSKIIYAIFKSINLKFCQKNLNLYMEFHTSHFNTFHRRRRLLL
jgi:hypothetical protein